MAIFTFAIRKGGVGKSSSAADLALYLAQRGRRVLAIDLDPQCNLTTRLGIPMVNDLAAVAADVLPGSTSLTDAAVPSPRIDGVHVIAGSEDLADLENRPEILMSLRNQLRADIDGLWDDVVIDTSTFPGLVTQTGLAAADQVIAPIDCAGEALLALAFLEGLIDRKLVKTRLLPAFGVSWVIPTCFHIGHTLDQQVLEQLRASYGHRVTPTIREAAAVRQSFVAQMPVSLYDPKSNVAGDYTAVFDHITQDQEF